VALKFSITTALVFVTTQFVIFG